jgi:hypothetical protein
MLDIPAAFAADYAEAREKFLDAARARALPVEHHVHPTARGAHGDELAADLAVIGDPSASAMLLLTSAMHGVEGFCGSGCQVALVRDDDTFATLADSGIAVALLHAVNPAGFSHLRRVNEDNVDVNRNFLDFGRPIARNEGYASVHAVLVPDEWPPSRDNAEALAASAARHGSARLQAIVTSGQSEFPDGLFYAGRAPAWSNRVLRDVLRRHGAHRRALGWIDFHTGLGPWGHGEKIYSGPDDAATIARARAWYGGDVTSFYDGTSTSAPLTGVAYRAAVESCPGATFTGIALEFGTVPLSQTLQALRADQWLANHPAAGEALREAIKRQVRDAFCDDGVAWRAMHHQQCIAQRWEMHRGEQRLRQQLQRRVIGQPFERLQDQPAHRQRPDPLDRRVNRIELIAECLIPSIDDPIAWMDDLQSVLTRARRAVAANAGARRELRHLRGPEMEEAKHQGGARCIADRDPQHRPVAEAALHRLHHALDLHRDSWLQVADGTDARAVLVMARQLQPQVLQRGETSRCKFLGDARTDARQPQQRCAAYVGEFRSRPCDTRHAVSRGPSPRRLRMQRPSAALRPRPSSAPDTVARNTPP